MDPATTRRSAWPNLTFRRQFLLSEDPDIQLEGGRKLMVAGRYHLSVHMDLELTHLSAAGNSLTLLGFALDPDYPEDDNAAILLRLLSAPDLLAATHSLGGRWVLIAEQNGRVRLFQDATGQRQVYYTRDSNGGIVCASECGLLAESLGLSIDRDAVRFNESRGIDDYEIYWMPGDSSLFAGVRALLPNHFLRLDEAEVVRFWPTEGPRQIDPDQALGEVLRLLRGQFESAGRRYKLSVPMTAGWDSRLMLALAREEKDDLFAFTLAYPHLSAGSRDVRVPAKLLAGLGMTHTIIPYPETADPDFRDMFTRSNPAPTSAYCRDIEALARHYPEHRVCVTGDAAEIVKCYYQRKSTAKPDAAELSVHARMKRHPFAVAAFTTWLRGVPDTGYELLDLFCWEQMAGRWQAKIRAEYDMVQECFSPLNNRRLLEVLLGVDASLRQGPDHLMFVKVIQALWPETLTEPINPPEILSRSRRVLAALKMERMLDLVPHSTRDRIKALLK